MFTCHAWYRKQMVPLNGGHMKLDVSALWIGQIDEWTHNEYYRLTDNAINILLPIPIYLFFFFNLLLFSLRSLWVNACFHKDPHVYTLHLFLVIHKLCQYIYSRADSQHSPQIIKQRWADLDVLHVTPLPDNDRS